MRRILLICLALLSVAAVRIPGPGGKPAASGGFAHVQNSTQHSGSGASSTPTFGVGTTANNLVVCTVRTAVSKTLSATDNAGTPNTYDVSSIPAKTTPGGLYEYQIFGVQTTGGATVVTISWTTSTSNRAMCEEYSGGKTSNATVFNTYSDGRGTGTSASVTSFSPNAGELVHSGCIFNNGGTITQGTNYVKTANSGAFLANEYRLSATTTETAPITSSNGVDWACSAAAYKPL